MNCDMKMQVKKHQWPHGQETLSLEPKLRVWGQLSAPRYEHTPRLEGSWAHTSSHHPYTCTRKETRAHTGKKELWPALVWATGDKLWGKNPEESPSCCPDIVPAELGALLLRTQTGTIVLTAVTLSLGKSPCRSLGLCPSLLNQDDDGAFLPVGEINSLSCRANVPIVQIKTTYVGLHIPINSAFASAPYLMHNYATKNAWKCVPKQQLWQMNYQHMKESMHGFSDKQRQ